MRTAVSRADLLYWLLQTGAATDSLERIARFAGFERIEAEPEPPQAMDISGKFRTEPELTETQSPALPTPKSSMRWFYVSARTPSGERAERGELLEEEPLSIQGVGELTAEDLAGAASAPGVKFEPLLTWARLWPFLQHIGGAPRAGAVDVLRLAEAIAAGRLLSRLPRRKTLGWSPELIVLADYNPRTLPFWDDFNRLCQRLLAMRGAFGLSIRKAGYLPGGHYTLWRQPDAVPQTWRMPPPGTPLLILSDLGLLESPESAVRAHWLRFGRQLAAAGLAPVVLAPLSPSHIDAELTASYRIAPWSRASRLTRQRRCSASDSLAFRDKYAESRLAFTRRAVDGIAQRQRLEDAVTRLLGRHSH